MTEREKKAKINAIEKQFREVSKHRNPVSKDEKLPPVCSMQIDKNKMKELEVLNSKEATVVNLDTPIPAKDYDKREKTGKKTSQKREEETTRD